MNNEKRQHGIAAHALCGRYFGSGTMPRKNTRNTRGKIISAAWKLFYENGYDETTIEDIIFESHTSRGSFYHYFSGKDALLGTLAYLFDEKYEQLEKELDESMTAQETLVFLNRELFMMIENQIPRELLSRLLSTQLLAQGEKHLMDRSRTYFKLLRRIVSRGREKGELCSTFSGTEIVNAYAMWERALLYDWCLSGGEYSLVAYTDQMTPLFLAEYRGF